MTKRQIAAMFKKLDKLGVGEIHLEFSGGGDEGGPDTIYVYDSNGNHMAESVLDSISNDPLNHFFLPAEDHFGGFNGSGVYGTLYWKVEDRRVYYNWSYEEWVDGPTEHIYQGKRNGTSLPSQS